MSGQLYFVEGQRVYYARKGSVDDVTITSGPRHLAGNHGHQYLVREEDGREEWCHEMWLVYTREEALARREAWEHQGGQPVMTRN